MDRGARWATIYGVARVRHDLATKPVCFNFYQGPINIINMYNIFKGDVQGEKERGEGNKDKRGRAKASVFSISMDTERRSPRVLLSINM